LIVDGAEVDITVRSTWQRPPSMAPALGGMAVGLIVIVAAALLRARIRTLSMALIVIATAASILGIVATVSVPPETGPPWSLWVPPLAALLMGSGALVGGLFDGSGRWASAPALLGALVLTVWGFLHQEWMWRAVLPTAGPFWVERLVTGAVLVVGIGLVMLIGRERALRTVPGVAGR